MVLPNGCSFQSRRCGGKEGLRGTGDHGRCFGTAGVVFG